MSTNMPAKDLSNWCFENEFKITSNSMYISRAHPFLARDKFWFLQFLILTILNAICLFCLCNSIFLHDIKGGNYADASKNIAMLIICFNSNMKYYTMLYHRNSVANLIHTIDRDYELAKQFEDKEKNIILSYSKMGENICRFWFLVGIVTSSIFPVKAFCMMAYYFTIGEFRLVPMFDLTFPYFIDRYKEAIWAFSGLFGLCFFFDFYAFFVYIGFEPLIPIFTSHTCGQLELLSLRISTVISESKSMKEMEAKLRSIVINLQELYSFIEDVQNDFMILMEFNMKTTTFILPCTAFQVVEDFRMHDIINIEFITLLIAATIHFLTPCYFCDIIIEASDKFREAVYSCGWEQCRYSSVKKTVLFIITRTVKPFSISTIFYNISLDTFSTMCRQAYALFNVMTAAWT